MGIYWDSSSKGQDKNLRRTRYHACWRAEKTVNGKKFRKRFKSYADAELWLSLFDKNKKQLNQSE